jgi:hypothetical protein
LAEAGDAAEDDRGADAGGVDRGEAEGAGNCVELLGGDDGELADVADFGALRVLRGDAGA